MANTTVVIALAWQYDAGVDASDTKASDLSLHR